MWAYVWLEQIEAEERSSRQKDGQFFCRILPIGTKKGTRAGEESKV